MPPEATLLMRLGLLTTFVLLLALPTWAAKRLSVTQLEQMLDADVAAHKQDAEIARKISGIELSERLTEVALGRLNQHFASDSDSAAALLLLADRSAFLDPPANELPANPAPDAAAQQRLLQSAQKFAIETLPRLPNLLATRTTFGFDDSPQEVTKGGYFQRIGMHLVGSSKAEVSVHNERENPSKRSGASPTQASGGLMTWGEFGSALLIILSDSAQGKTTWSHWEQTSSGLMAVFHYEVPKAASHYEIDTSVQEIQSSGESSRWAGARTRDAGAVSSWTRMIRTRPAYQGSLWIDPATGTITRVTLVVDLKGNPRFERGAILVEYGPVTVGDRTLICPVRSLALSAAPSSVDTTFSGVATEWLNENLFTNYHLFASTSRILTEQTAAETPSTTPSVDTAGKTSSVAAGPAAQADNPVGAPVAPPPSASVSAAPLPPAAPTMVTAAAAPAAAAPLEAAPVPTPDATAPPASNQAGEQKPAAAPVSGAPSTTAATEPAGEAQNSPTLPLAQPTGSPDKGYTLRVQVNAILVPVVVRDKQDRAIGDLTAKDFTVFDQGKPRPVTGFTVVHAAVPEKRSVSPSQALEQAPVPAVSKQNRFIVFLFDDRHLYAGDLVRTREAAIRVFSQPLPANEYAAVVSLMGVNSGITRDPVVLQDAVRKVSMHLSFLHDTHDCPDIDYYSADQILNRHNVAEFGLAVAKVDACIGTREAMAQSSAINAGQIEAPTQADQRLALSAARRAVAVGEEDARESLKAVETVVHAMANLTGQRTLILLSPGFLSVAPDAMNFKSQLFDQAAASNVVINTLDARGLYVGNMDASQGGSGAFLSQSNGETSQDTLNSMEESENALSEMAYGTGGKYFHNNNDLAAGIETLMAPPEFEYLLEVSLKDVKQTGTFHLLQVKVDRPGVHVQARHGYFAPKEAQSKK